ncbi:MAG: hypothetical protein ABEI98_02145 [Halorhabdus sp.]
MVSDEETYVGDSITMQGRGLPEHQDLELIWHTADGEWGIIKANQVIGPQYQPRTELIETVTTDDTGQFSTQWRIPQDYGGGHVIEVQTAEGETLANAEISITPWFEIDRTTAPLGEQFTITGYGLGPNFLQNNYQIAWDNGTVGFITGVKNRGTATGRIRATGPPGKHVVQVWRNYRGVPFLQNNTQSPYGPVAGGRQSVWTVEVEEPESAPRTAWTSGLQDEEPISSHYPDLDADTRAEMRVVPSSGQAGTTAVIQGRRFPANTAVDLVWHRHEGHRVQGIPITPEPKPDVLPTVETDDEGTFQVQVTIPSDVGATRPITAEIDGRSVAVTGFVLQQSIVDISPTEGPVGTEIEIEISGVGWTEYGNAPFFVYDNKPLGYVCGVDDEDSPGKVRTVLRASGTPGYHFIDIYPSIFEMQEDDLEFELKPHLSHVDNHPVRPLPAMHCTFEVTE